MTKRRPGTTKPITHADMESWRVWLCLSNGKVLYMVAYGQQMAVELIRAINHRKASDPELRGATYGIQTREGDQWVVFDDEEERVEDSPPSEEE